MIQMIHAIWDDLFFVFLAIWIWLMIEIIKATDWKEFSKTKLDEKVSLALLWPHEKSGFMKYIKPGKRKLILRLFLLVLLLPFALGLFVSLTK